MKLFFSTTLKLAGWYLMILMTVSLLFSSIIFLVASTELNSQLHGFLSQSSQQQSPPATAEQARQPKISHTSLISSLGYLNLLLLCGGGVVSYVLARRTLEPIEATHEAQSRFTANASHQLRTPLAIMKAETELALADPKATKANLRRALRSNLEEVNRLTQLTELLLKLSHANRSLETDSETFDLAQLIQSLIHDRRAGDRVALHTPADTTLTTHKLVVREMLAILLDNALKHSPAQSTVSIDVTHSRQALQVAISNDGAISPWDLPYIFERFFSGQPHADGYGLGLSLAKQLAGTLGSQLTAQSRKNQTIFTISLPKS